MATFHRISTKQCQLTIPTPPPLVVPAAEMVDYLGVFADVDTQCCYAAEEVSSQAISADGLLRAAADLICGRFASGVGSAVKLNRRGWSTAVNRMVDEGR